VADLPAFRIVNRTDAARVMRDVRMAKGMTCLDLDHHAGFQDGYTAKLEHPDTPSGKRGLQVSYMFEVWLEALGYVFALLPQDMAESLKLQSYTAAGTITPFKAHPPPTPKVRPRARPISSFRRIAPHAA